MRALLLLPLLGLLACASSQEAADSEPVEVGGPSRLLIVLDLGNTVAADAEAFAGTVQADLDARGAEAQVIQMRTGFGDARLVAAIEAFEPQHTVLVTASQPTRIAEVPGLTTRRGSDPDALPASLVVLNADGIAMRDEQVLIRTNRAENGPALLLRAIRRLGVPMDTGS